MRQSTPNNGVEGKSVLPQGKKRRRRLRRSVRRALVLAGAVGLVLGVSAAVTLLIRRIGGGEGMEPSALPSAAVSVDVPSAAASAGGAFAPVDSTGWGLVGPLANAATPLLRPESRIIALQENGRIDLQYFGDAVFVGDSITQGLQYWDVIPNANYCAYVGASPRSIYSGEVLTREDGVSEVPLEALEGYRPARVYILMGTNAMAGMDDESMLAYYGEMLDAIKARLGETVDIYIQSVTPVLPGAIDGIDAARIQSVNSSLALMAFDKGCYYLDLYGTLADENGFLRAEYAADDGYHMQPAGYRAWAEYLVTHTAYNSSHAALYLEGSPYYTETAG